MVLVLWGFRRTSQALKEEGKQAGWRGERESQPQLRALLSGLGNLPVILDHQLIQAAADEGLGLPQ